MILGQVSLFPIEFAARIAELSRSVCHLSNSGRAATGFLIDTDVVLTADFVIGPKADWPNQEFVVDFDRTMLNQNGDSRPLLETVPFPWSNPAANDLCSLLCDAYPAANARIGILQQAGVPKRNLLIEGTPADTWRQNLGVTANMHRMSALIDVILKDPAMSGYHKTIREAIKRREVQKAIPIAADSVSGWAALRLDHHVDLAPLILHTPTALEPGTNLISVQHPHGGRKQFTIAQDGFLKLTETEVLYRMDTMAGSSGAPVLDESLRVIALHRRASEKRDHNAGTRIDSIKQGLEANSLRWLSESDPDS